MHTLTAITIRNFRSSLVHDFFPSVCLHLEIPVPDITTTLNGGTIKVSEREGAVRDFDFTLTKNNSHAHGRTF